MEWKSPTITKPPRGGGQGVSRNYFILLYLELIRNFIEIHANTAVNRLILGGVGYYFTRRFPTRQCIHVLGDRFFVLKICRRPDHWLQHDTFQIGLAFSFASHSTCSVPLYSYPIQNIV
jgi:hypothetical protein